MLILHISSMLAEFFCWTHFPSSTWPHSRLNFAHLQSTGIKSHHQDDLTPGGVSLPLFRPTRNNHFLQGYGLVSIETSGLKQAFHNSSNTSLPIYDGIPTSSERNAAAFTAIMNAQNGLSIGILQDVVNSDSCSTLTLWWLSDAQIFMPE